MNRLRLTLACCGLFLLSACGQTTPPLSSSQNSASQQSWPAMKTFAAARPSPAVRRSNQDLAADYLDLMFALESGPKLPVLTRFEGPVTIAFTRDVRSTLSNDLDQLLGRLRREAKINIRRVQAGTPANIIIETIPAKTLFRQVPGAACFVVPNVSSWNGFLKGRFSGVTDWTKVRERKQVLVVMPSDVAPQEHRDCLHEEIAQGLGPLNDLYHLPDSVYNDDNFQLILSPFDMLMLRLTYAPELQTGMTRNQVAAKLPALLNRMNPAGRSIAARNPKRTSQTFKRKVETALGPRASRQSRLNAANEAISIANGSGYNDHRLGFAYFARARINLEKDPLQSVKDFSTAAEIFSVTPGQRSIHFAHAAMQLTTLWMAQGRVDQAEAMLDQLIPTAKSEQDALTLFSLYALKGEIQRSRGNSRQAKASQAQAIGWGRYGFGSDEEIGYRLKEVDGLIQSNPNEPDRQEGS